MAGRHSPGVLVREPSPLHERAMDNLAYIRQTMEGAAAFTAVPGWGLVAIGVTALCAAFLSAQQTSPRAWLLTWAGEAAVAFAIAAWTMVRKARRARVPLFSAPGRKFALGFSPPIAAGAVLTIVLYRAGALSFLPGMWLLLYGAAVVAAGVFSVSVVPAMGLCFMALGTAALIAPAAWTVWLPGLAFGLLHIIFGTMIARAYGG